MQIVLQIVYLLCYRPRLGNLFTITSRMKCALSLEGRKSINFILKLYLYPTMRKRDFSWLTV